MNTIEKYIQISRIIALSYFRDLNPAEKEKLECWLADDPDHQKIYKKFTSSYDFSKSEKNRNQLDKDEIWKNIYAEISRQKKKTLPLYKKLLRYAAILLIPLAVAFTAWYVLDDLRSMNQNIEIKPGMRMAKLILDGGREIKLGGSDTLLRVRKDAVDIKIDSAIVAYQRKEGEVPNRLDYHTIKIPKGGEYSLSLSDGTKVWLNAETEFRFPANFTGNERRVYLKGEAFFQVAKDESQPFIVQANGMNTKVLGTSFNISAYPDDEYIHTTLIEGSVFVNEEISGLGQSAMLKPSEQAYINLGDTIQLKVHEVDPGMYAAWVDGKFVFKNTSLDEVLKKFSRWYNVEVFYENEKVKSQTFTGIIPRFENCETILQLMERTNSVVFQYDESTIIVNSTQ